MAYIRERAEVTAQKRITKDIYELWFESSFIAENAEAGQFVTVYSKDGSRLLPRPFGISQISKEKNQVCFVYRVVGEGTREFSSLIPGDFIEVTGPLGNGFTIRDSRALLVGGGTGIPIIIELAKRVKEKTQQPPYIIVGFRDETYLLEELAEYGDLIISTEDGSAGIKGNVIDALKEKKIEVSVIYACGPHPMLRALKEYASYGSIELQVSLEEKMACGIGACLACTCKTKEVDEYTGVHNKRICKEGPVFQASEVEI